MSTFDSDSFLNTTVETELDTQFPTFEAGKYPALVDKVDTSDGIIGKGDNVGKPWASLNIHWSIQDEGVKQEMDRDKVIVVQRIFLDLDENANLAVGKGKNVKLGKVLEVFGLNDGSPWTPNMMLGQQAEVDVVLGANQDGDPRNDVRGIAPLEG